MSGSFLKLKQALIDDVLTVYPCGTDPNHVLTDVHVANLRAADGPSIPIGYLHGNGDIFAEYQVGKRLLGAIPIGLPALWCVDFGQPDLDLPFFRSKQGKRVAIGHSDDATTKLARRNGD